MALIIFKTTFGLTVFALHMVGSIFYSASFKWSLWFMKLLILARFFHALLSCFLQNIRARHAATWPTETVCFLHSACGICWRISEAINKHQSVICITVCLQPQLRCHSTVHKSVENIGVSDSHSMRKFITTNDAVSAAAVLKITNNARRSQKADQNSN